MLCAKADLQFEAKDCYEQVTKQFLIKRHKATSFPSKPTHFLILTLYHKSPHFNVDFTISFLIFIANILTKAAKVKCTTKSYDHHRFYIKKKQIE